MKKHCLCDTRVIRTALYCCFKEIISNKTKITEQTIFCYCFMHLVLNNHEAYPRRNLFREY